MKTWKHIFQRRKYVETKFYGHVVLSSAGWIAEEEIGDTPFPKGASPIFQGGHLPPAPTRKVLINVKTCSTPHPTSLPLTFALFSINAKWQIQNLLIPTPSFWKLGHCQREERCFFSWIKIKAGLLTKVCLGPVFHKTLQTHDWYMWSDVADKLVQPMYEERSDMIYGCSQGVGGVRVSPVLPRCGEPSPHSPQWWEPSNPTWGKVLTPCQRQGVLKTRYILKLKDIYDICGWTIE